MDDEDIVTDVPETEPIYQYRTWENGPMRTQCTSSGFCFLCQCLDSGENSGEGEEVQYEDTEDEETIADDARSIIDYITLCVRQHKPVDFIVMGVYRYYEKKVRHKIPEYADECGEIVHKPEWSREVIVKHLMFDARPEWNGIFSQACTLMLRGLVIKANDMVIDKLTKRLDGDAAKMLCDFIDKVNRHRKDSLNNELLERRLYSGGVFAGKASAARRIGHRGTGGEGDDTTA